jgi:hypothetical protein
MSFCLSFHPALLGLTGAHWLDDPPDPSCKDSTQQYPWTIRGCLVTGEASAWIHRTISEFDGVSPGQQTI